MTLDYKSIGLKVGLEVHQQLDTGKKLFCSCQTELFKEGPTITFLRRLRPTQSELGQVDPAAFFEFQKGVQILYEANNETSCLVEMDEEPPHDLNRNALEVALTISLMLGATPVNEIHVMRKTVIDGSNTTGFQRTCVVAFNGKVESKERPISIQHVSLEEDAARKMGEANNILRYRIDRLGIPLVEVTTAPVIHTPQEAGEVALAVGRVLRATGMVKRGLGTIRQDLNVSIQEGAIVEIKGVQELELVSVAVENEVQRQLKLLEIREELAKRGVKEEDLQDEFVDVTHVFVDTKCMVIRSAVEKRRRVLAVRLPSFEGLLKRELMPDVRLGTEMADRARFWGRVGGIFHTDEVPAYGITAEEIDELKRVLKAKPQDAVVFVADALENASDALWAVVERSKEALEGVPQETRASKPDGTTRYMRPRPGAARMYPETDVPPIQISQSDLDSLRECLPELPEQKMQRLVKAYGLNEKLVKQVLDSEFSQLFEEAVNRSGALPTLVAVVLTETLKALGRDGVEVERVSDGQYLELFRLVGSGEVAKEAVPDVIAWLAKHEKARVSEAVEALGLGMLLQSELETIVDGLIEENRRLLEERGEKAFSVLMGLVMGKVRGRVKADSVAELVKHKLGKPKGHSSRVSQKRG
ncbi:MAG: Glu-tRNA(Gln) amidotransferase subunit GatE [Candidatus Bathyarchaeia archaeon]